MVPMVPYMDPMVNTYQVIVLWLPFWPIRPINGASLVAFPEAETRGGCFGAFTERDGTSMKLQEHVEHACPIQF